MDLFIKIPVLFDKHNCVDYFEMERLLTFDENIKGIILFSKDFEGKTLSFLEKKEIFLKIKKMTKVNLIYAVNDILTDEEINLINELKPDYIILSLIKDNKLCSKGFEKYIIKTLKKLDVNVILHLDDSFENCKVSYKSFVNIARLNRKFLGIFDESKDNYFIKKLSNINDIQIFTTLDKYFEHDNKKIIKGIVNDYYLIFQKEIVQYFYESSYGFVNPVLINYLKFIEECISYYPRSMAIKYLLNKKGYQSTYSRLPYYVLKGEEKDKLDFIF